MGEYVVVDGIGVVMMWICDFWMMCVSFMLV